MPPHARKRQLYCSRACQGVARRIPIEERFWSKVSMAGPDECWEWMGSRNTGGYGWFKVGDRATGSHRVAFELTSGPIPDGLLIRHRCDNPPCCNPAHMELGTPADNAADRTERGRHHLAKVTHCKHGHPLSGENLYVTRKGVRQCRECVRAAKRRHYHRTKGLA